MNLIRLLLLQLEGEQEVPELSGYTEEQQVYNMALCIEAGLVVGEVVNDGNGYPKQTVAIRLTWNGHDFLDAARDNNLWKKARQHVLKPGLSWTFQLLSDYLKHEIQQRIMGGAPPPP